MVLVADYIRVMVQMMSTLGCALALCANMDNSRVSTIFAERTYARGCPHGIEFILCTFLVAGILLSLTSRVESVLALGDLVMHGNTAAMSVSSRSP